MRYFGGWLAVVLSPGWLSGVHAQAPDIYDQPHSAQYANHLFSNKQYELAATEYERLVFMDSTNLQYKSRLFESYRHSGQTETGIRRFSELFPDFTSVNEPFASQYTDLLLFGNHYATAELYLQTNPHLQPVRDYYFMNLDFFNGRWTSAQQYYKVHADDPVFKPYQSLAQRSAHLTLKSPALAGLLSTVIPGAGKAYAHEWKDGLFSFLLVGSSFFEAWHSYHIRGTRSVNAWIFAGLGAGFYLGNIYGSVKSARRYNAQKQAALSDEAKHIFSLQHP